MEPGGIDRLLAFVLDPGVLATKAPDRATRPAPGPNDAASDRNAAASQSEPGLRVTLSRTARDRLENDPEPVVRPRATQPPPERTATGLQDELRPSRQSRAIAAYRSTEAASTRSGLRVIA